MKTHAESIWIDDDDLPSDGDSCGLCVVTRDEQGEGETEFVPAAAYLELKAKLETAEYSANGFESLYDATHKELADLKAVAEKALTIIEQYGGTDESHHQTWVIDQVVRALTGEGYAKWVDDMKGATGDNGTREYDWNEGVEP